MDEVLNFNRHRPPTLSVELDDADHTVLRILPPTVDLQEELRAKGADLNALLAGGEEEQREGLYDLAARLMSCHRNMRKITAEQLRATYKLDEEDLVVFFNAYVNFIQRLENAKN